MLQTKDKIYINNGNINLINLVNSLNLPSTKSILDIGIGNGANARILKEKFHHIDGITLSNVEANSSKEIYNQIFIHNLETGIPEILLNHKYDIILCSHLIEHIAYPESLLNSIKILMSSDSFLIVCIPNIMHYQSRNKIILGNFPHNSNSGIWDYTHLRWYTFDSISQLFSSNNFLVIKIFGNIEIPFGRITQYFPKRLIKIIKLFLQFISKGYFSNEIILLLKKGTL